MLKKNLQWLLLTFAITITIGCENSSKKTDNFNEYVTFSYQYLEQALQTKKQGLINYLSNIRALSAQAKNDVVLNSFFKAKNDYYLLQKDKVAIPANFKSSINNLKQKINKHYLNNYLPFYDLLFINTEGDIFFTIRKEPDYHSNIHDSLFIHTDFTKKLITSPTESFIDFQFYSASGMPSAFFIEPVFENKVQLGWIVLQLTVEKINHMFNDNNSLGQSGEIILVNKEHYLLTESRFINETSILKQKLPNDNIEAKFREKKGTKAVTDYRGIDVFSVFEVFSFMNNEWLIIAKKDKAELVNEYYKQNEDMLIEKINKRINQKLNAHHKTPTNSLFTTNEPINTVFIDDYKRTDSSATLFTQGISTCTSVCFTYKNEFSYMAHISPYDAIYNENRSDLLKTVMDKIEYFDLTISEKKELNIYITFTNLETLKNIITKLIGRQYKLNQIKVAYNNHAEYANVYCTNNNTVWINWHYNNGKIVSEHLTQQQNIQEILLN